MSTPTLREAAQALATLRKRYEGHTDHTHPANDQWRLAFTEGYRTLEAILATQAADAGAAEPVAWQHRMGPTDNWDECTKEFHDWVLREPKEWGAAEVRALYAAQPAQQLQQAVARALAEQREQIAQGWDGCMYDAVGETIDIGAAIRQQGTP